MKNSLNINSFLILETTGNLTAAADESATSIGSSPPFIGRYFESSRERAEVKFEYVEPGCREPDNVDVIKLEPDLVTEVYSDVKQELDEAVSVKIEQPGLHQVDSFVGAKLELSIKEEPTETGSDDAFSVRSEGVTTVRASWSSVCSTGGAVVIAEEDHVYEASLESRCNGSSLITNGLEGVKKEEEEQEDLLSRQEASRLRRLDLLRPWTKTGLGRELESGQHRPFPARLGFRILSYNILAPSHLERQRRRLFKGRTSADLDWSRRLRSIQREIETLRPDIVCLQEVPFASADHVQEDLANYFSQRGFDCVGRRRHSGADDGCAIFYRTAIFTLEAWKAVESSSPSSGRPSRTLGVICRLRPADAAVTSRLVVATVHLRQGRAHFLGRLVDTALLLAGEYSCQGFYFHSVFLLLKPVFGSGSFCPYPDRTFSCVRIGTKSGLNC